MNLKRSVSLSDDLHNPLAIAPEHQPLSLWKISRFQRTRIVIRMLPGLPGQVRERKVFNPSKKSYPVVKTINGVSIMDVDIFEVHHKRIQVCQRDPRVTPQ